MKKGVLWRLFADTGDPICWLYLRAAEKENNEQTAD